MRWYRIICSLIIIIYLCIYIHKSVFAAISFSITNPTYENEMVNVDVSLSGLTTSSCASSSCYLQAGLKNFRTDRYFGFTKNDKGDWIVYNSSTDKTTIQSTFFTFSPINGNWTGKISAKADPNDTDYEGPGSYGLRLWRYTGNSDNSAGDPTNELSITLTGPTLTPTNTSTPTQTPTDTPTHTCTPKPTNTVTPTLTNTPTVNPSTTLTPSIEEDEREQDIGSSNEENSEVAEVLGAEATQSSMINPQTSFRTFVIAFAFVGGGFGLLSLIFTLQKMRMK